MMASLAVPTPLSQASTSRSVVALHRLSAGIFLTALAFCFLPQPAWAEHLCAGRSDEYTVSEVYDASGNAVEYWCEWGSSGGGDGSRQMQHFSAEQWKAFADHGAEVEKKNAEERIMMGQQMRQLQAGKWFLPGEEPFADSPSGVAAPQRNPGRAECSASYWTTDGAVTLNAAQGRDGEAFIVYQGYGIPVPSEPTKKQISLTQSGETQKVTALVSLAGNAKRKMGSITFFVPTGSALVDTIEDVQDYALADEDGKLLFSGKWHDGLKARDALNRCFAQR